MGTNSYITKLKAQLDQAIIQREHWKQLAGNRNSILVTEVCPDKCAALEAERERLADALDRQSAITGDYIARCQRLADELAITRRVIDRIGQLCTTPHESKERFIRRVQSVIEWEAQAISAKASP